MKITVNAEELIQNWIARKNRAMPVAEQIAWQMGHTAENEIHPITRKKTGQWDSSIHTEVINEGDRIKLWVGSHGAFSPRGYNYGALQEALNHPIEIGFHRALPDMREFFRIVFPLAVKDGESVPKIKIMAGLVTLLVDQI